ncbi:MAG: hypothetical protein DMG36_00535 [Acidobacteria bacterium]|nr:MAG: hypothetical protein DMG36_00535 [Acidobacteriota bacterium]
MIHNTSLKYLFLQLKELFANGWMGVDLFYIVGFLITGIPLETTRKDILGISMSGGVTKRKAGTSGSS